MDIIDKHEKNEQQNRSSKVLMHLEDYGEQQNILNKVPKVETTKFTISDSSKDP